MRKLFLTGACLFALAQTASAAVYYPYGSGGGGTPGGTNGQIQYNNSGAFGGLSSVAASGDVSINASGVATVTGIQGTAVSTPTGTGAVVLQTSPTLTGGLTLGSNLTFSAATPTISSGFGSSPSVTAGTATSFRLNVGTGGTATNGVVGLATATNGWNCSCTDITTNSSTVFMCKQTASTVSSATLGNFNTSAAAAAWVASDILAVSCVAY
jgi:hypothetical protein